MKKKVSVVGLGFVGLPLACILSDKYKNDAQIVGIDRKINNKTSSIKRFLYDFKKGLVDKKMLSLLKKIKNNKNLFFSNDISSIKNSDTIIVSVNFDFKRKKINKSFNNLKNLFAKIANNINKKTLIILETTVPPGTSDRIILPLINKILKKKNARIKVNYAYSYERVMPGEEYLNSIINMSRCYAGKDLQSSKLCLKFFSSFINAKKFPLHKLENIKDCETAKILENSFRAVNIAFIDEWTKYASNIGVNLNKVIYGIKKRKTHNNIMRPGLGVGGYCLTKDPSFAVISSKYLYKKNLNFPITTQSININRRMPLTTIKFLDENLPKKRLKILILGASYKENVADIRYSPSIELFKKLKNKGHKVFIHDPLVSKLSIPEFKKGKLSNFSDYNAVIFCVAHKFYKKLNFNRFSKKPYYFDVNIVFDEKVIKKMKEKKYKIKVLGSE